MKKVPQKVFEKKNNVTFVIFGSRFKAAASKNHVEPRLIAYAPLSKGHFDIYLKKKNLPNA